MSQLTQEKLEEVVRLFHEGSTLQQTAEIMGISKTWVSNWRHIARRKGMLPPVIPKSVHTRAINRLRYQNTTIGSMKDLFDGCSKEVADWLVNQVSPKVSVADVIRAIVIDAYLDEKETKELLNKKKAAHTPMPYAGKGCH